MAQEREQLVVACFLPQEAVSLATTGYRNQQVHEEATVRQTTQPEVVGPSPAPLLDPPTVLQVRSFGMAGVNGTTLRLPEAVRRENGGMGKNV